MMLPTFSVAVQNVFPREHFGLVTSTVQFFRNMGATIGAAIFGSIMLRSMNNGFAGVDLSNVSPHVASLLRNPRVLVNPEALRQIQMRIPPEGLSLFSQLLDKTKSILANSLGRVFLAGVIMAGVALVITLFLREVPLSRGDARVEGERVGEKRVEKEPRIVD
jgi:hypothetical protein